jgi:hypothetical protein
VFGEQGGVDGLLNVHGLASGTEGRGFSRMLGGGVRLLARPGGWLGSMLVVMARTDTDVGCGERSRRDRERSTPGRERAP